MAGIATENMRPMPFSSERFYGSGYILKTINIGNDVTDNKTNETIQICQIKGPTNKKYVMNDIFHREDERIKTFEAWPLNWMDKNILAMTGMFFTGEDDKVKCYFCEVEIGQWERVDEPVPEHMRWSPNCPLLRRRTTNNVPINSEALDRMLPAISYDICGANDPILETELPELRLMTSTASTSSLADEVGGGSGVAFAHGGCNTASSSALSYFPKFPEYAIESARLRSFADWPRHMKQKPQQLAEAGFFYTGVGDRVKCFSCGGGLKDWDENDEPWEQHSLWLSKCRFIKLMKGQNYIDQIVMTKRKAEEESSEQQVSGLPTDVAAMSHNKSSNVAATLSELDVNPNTLQAVNCAVAAPPQTAAARIFQKINAAPQTPTAESAQMCDNNIETTRTAGGNSNSSIPEEKLCKICYAGEYNTAFLPCGHVVACAKCASSVTKCPLCRKPFTDVMRVYFS